MSPTDFWPEIIFFDKVSNYFHFVSFFWSNWYVPDRFPNNQKISHKRIEMTENGLIFKLTRSSSLDGSALSWMNHCHPDSLIFPVIKTQYQAHHWKSNIRIIKTDEKSISEKWKWFGLVSDIGLLSNSVSKMRNFSVKIIHLYSWHARTHNIRQPWSISAN